MTTFSIRGFQTPKLAQIGDAALLISVILAGTVFPRLMFLGLFPAMDDGYYAYIAQQIYHSLANGQGIPDSGGLSLYPLLCSWVFSFGYNPIISLRLIDLGVAIITAFLLYRILAKTCNSNTGVALITFIFTFTLNQALFIDSGFKNSITAAFAPLFLALYVGMGAIQSKKSGNAWQLAGALTALAVVLRETFAPFAVLGLVSVFIAQGKKAALRFFIGGVATGILWIGGILMARGGVVELIAAYHSAGAVFGAVPNDLRLDHFISYGWMAIRSSSIALTFSVLAIVILLFAIFLRRDKSLLLAAVFWLSFIGVALIEAATKICYAYHFAIALPGFAGLCALALREIIRVWPAIKLSKSMNNFLAVAGIVLSAGGFYASCSIWSGICWPVTLETLTAPGGTWPEKFTERSHYLLAAAEIKKVMPEKGTLSISRAMHVLYLLTGHSPPSPRLSDLSATAIILNFSVPDIRQALLDCAPDVIMVATHNDWFTGGGSPRLREAVLATGIYETVVKFPVSERPYGFLGGIIFRKTKETTCLVK
ncbi:MAG: hypothetical protein LBJ59_11220 [Zoogloeaceae bacterium]|jgi:hypothetical protein|nr:hypothetical protein [Zoogloeaceae bacterium]